MPKSKRSKLVSLTKTKKKDRKWKQDVIKRIQDTVSQYERIVLFRIHNMRTAKFQRLRDELRETSKFLVTPKRLTQFALGKDASSEHGTNLHKLAEVYQGDMGMMCTKLDSNAAVSLLENFKEEDFARMGETATVDFALPGGALHGPNRKFQHTLEPTLRDYGLPTKLNRGEIELLRDCEVCCTGDILTVNQANLLRLFDIKMSNFTLTPVAVFENGKVTLAPYVESNWNVVV